MGKFANEERFVKDWDYHHDIHQQVLLVIANQLNTKDHQTYFHRLINTNAQKFKEYVYSNEEAKRLPKIKEVTGVKEVKENSYDALVNNMEKNTSRLFYDNEHDLANSYMWYKSSYDQCLIDPDTIKKQGLEMSKKVKDVYEKKTDLLKFSAAGAKAAYEKQCNPLTYIFPPFKEFDEKKIEKAMPNIIRAFKNNPDAPGFLKEEKYFKQYIESCKTLRAYETIANEFKTLKEEKKLPENMQMGAKFMVEGKEVNSMDYVKAIMDGKNRSIEGRSELEIKNIKKELYSGKALSYTNIEKRKEAGELIPIDDVSKRGIMTSIMDSIEMFSDGVKKTDSIFSRDSKEYKLARDLAGKFAKEYKEANLDKTNTKKVMEYFESKKQDIEKIKNAIKSYTDVKGEKNKQEIAKGKKPNERSMTRFNLASTVSANMEQFLTGQRLEYTEAPMKPYRDTKVTEKVKSEIQASEKQNQKVQVKDLSKSKEMEMSMSYDNN